MPHVFISYSRKDTDFVEKLERDLNQHGIAIWRDKSSIVGGEEWYLSIVRGLEEACAMLLVVTPNSDESRWVRREALYADELGVHIIPVWPERYTARLHLHFLLIEKQPMYCDGDHYSSGLAQLTAKLADLSKTVSATPHKLAPSANRDTELAYLDFVLSEMKAELRTARYVNLGATRESTVLRKSSHPSLDEFEMSFDRFEPLVKAECLHGEDFDRAGEPVEDARDPLREMTRAILLGEPGSGKTTTLQQLTIDLAQSAQENPDAPLPVFVPLHSYTSGEQFSAFVQKQLGPLQSQYERLLADGRLVLLCDALNEMQRSANGRDLMTEVRDYLRERQPWIVSCRVRDYQDDLQDLTDVGKVRLKPLDLPRIKQVIDRRFSAEPERAAALWVELGGSDALLEAWQALESQKKTEAFWEPEGPEGFWMFLWEPQSNAWKNMHADRSCMLPLCRNPFMLFMVCGTFERMGKLPPNRGALFATFVDNLLRREEANSRTTGRAWIDAKIIRHALAQVAYAMQTSDTGSEISRIEVERILSAQPEISDAALLLRLAASASLLDVRERVRYTHQLLQEYLASEAMGAAMDERRSATEFWPATNWWKQHGWEETAAILAGVRNDPEGVARWIAPAQPEVAYRALTESGIRVDLDCLHPETREALMNSADAKKEEANPVGRAAAYRVLAVFEADTRRGVGLRADGLPEIEWVEIPRGAFIYQDNERVILPTFSISRYPITYRQFQAFIEATDGFDNPQWWQDLATDDDHKHALGKQMYLYWNHPRERVSWYDAVAFCRWLSSKLGYEVCLPTEQEWEKAARGTDGREYPYTGSFDADKGNAAKTGIRQTSAVGIFPAGASPYGVLDMSGNVWEWCLNEYDRPKNTGPKGSAQRVLRGGSWVGSGGDARAVFRLRYAPDVRFDSFGFRVLASHPM